MITAETHFTESEMRIARRNHLRRRKIWLWLYLLLGLGYIVWGGARLSSGGGQEGLYMAALIVGVYLVFRTPLLNWRAMRMIRRSPQINKSLRWSFTEDAAQAQGEGIAMTIRWDQFFETVSTPEGHLLYPQKGLYYWIPTTGFGSPEEEAKLLATLRTQRNTRNWLNP